MKYRLEGKWEDRLTGESGSFEFEGVTPFDRFEWADQYAREYLQCVTRTSEVGRVADGWRAYGESYSEVVTVVPVES